MTLKPAAYRCHICKSVSAFEGDRSVCHSICSTGGPATPLFTRDGLVRVMAKIYGEHDHGPRSQKYAKLTVAAMLGEVEE